MENCTVFYSWQSDLPNSTNRGFVQDALERATKAIREDDSITVEPVIDRDTAGVAGSPDIAATIFDKIDACQVFVCDVSIINDQESARPTPNPNVLVELGYALGILGWERILMVMNTAFGEPETLPFDLSKKRVIPYRLPKEGTKKAAERKELTSKLKDALRMIVDKIGEVRATGQLSGDKAKLKGECEAVLAGGSLHDWRRLVDQLWSPIPDQLIEWKSAAERVWDKGTEEKDKARFEAVEICLPSFVPIFVAVERGRKDLWKEAVGALRQLMLLRDRMGGGFVEVVEMGSNMLYIAGSLGMAIAARTKQLDFVNSWMRLPMPEEHFHDREGERPWAEVYSAGHLWGRYLPGPPDPFKSLWKVCQSDYLSGFFADKQLLEKHLFMGNLAQSLYELGRYTEDSKRLEALKAGEAESFPPSELRVWPVWALMKPDDFKSATWDLFGTSEGVLGFVAPRAGISAEDFWGVWKTWKQICVGPMERSALQRGDGTWPVAEWLLLPGEPHG